MISLSGLIFVWQNDYIVDLVKDENNHTTHLISDCSKQSIKLNIDYKDREHITKFESSLNYKNLLFNRNNNLTTYIRVYKNSTIVNAQFIVKAV